MISAQQAKLELARRKAKEDFWAYCLWMDYEFFTEREEVLKPIAEAFNRAWYSEKEYYRISVSLPPRTGKSYITSLFCSWSLGKDAGREIMRASYAEKLSHELHQAVRELLEDEKHTAVFNTIEFSESTKEKLRFKGQSRASLYATTVGGQTNGFGCAILVSDDMYKDMADATSKAVNDKTHSWYNTSFFPRTDGGTTTGDRKGKNIELMIGTKYTVDEVSYKLTEQGHFDEVIKVPAIVDGKSFCDKIYSLERLQTLQDILLPSEWLAQFMQEPSIAKDAYLTPSMIDWVEYGEYKVYSRFAFVDNKSKGKDYFSIPMFAITDVGVVVEDVIFTNRVLTDTLEDEIVDFLNKYQPHLVVLENNHDPSFIRNIQRRVKSKCVGKKTTKNKESKILNHIRYIPKLKFIRDFHREYRGFMNQMYSWEPENVGQHDDAIDSVVMGIIELLGRKSLGGREWIITVDL